MKVWNAIMIAVLCALALMYFDSTDKEKTNVRNSPLRSLSRDFRVDIGNISVYRVCVVPSKSGRKIVKCPVCDQWVGAIDAKNSKKRYQCADNPKFERIILVTQRKNK
jgi:hypothetical protein